MLVIGGVGTGEAVFHADPAGKLLLLLPLLLVLQNVAFALPLCAMSSLRDEEPFRSLNDMFSLDPIESPLAPLGTSSPLNDGASVQLLTPGHDTFSVA